MAMLLIVGSDSPESLESSYARAFRQAGWQVCFWQPLAAYNAVVHGGSLGRLFGLFVHVEPWWRKANLQLLQHAAQHKPDLLLVIGTQGLRPGTLAQLRAHLPRLVIYCLYPDSPHNLDSQRIHCLPFFDRVITSSPAWVNAFLSLGARHVTYLPFAADTELHRPAASPQNVQLAHDLAFIGTWRAEREDLLTELADYDLAVWGSDYWQKRTRPGSPLRRKWGRRTLIGAEFAQACAQSKIMLNVMDSISWPGPNMRTFELPACGAFALAERSEPVQALFREGETIEYFSDPAEAREKINYYLAHETARMRIARASHEFVTQFGHTYHDRVRTLCEWWAQDKKGM
jgi:spore maturation protein CgeB